MLSKTVHLRPLKCSSVIHVKTPEKEGRIFERNSIIEPDFEYKPIQKTAYDSSIYKFQREKLSKAPTPSDVKLPQTAYLSRSEGSGPEIVPLHAPEYFVHKKKKYNEQAQIINNVPLSNIISQDHYKTLRSTSLGFSLTPAAERGEEADRRNVYRRNLFISKANEINHDFKFQPLIRNAQTTSEDTPYWFQGTAKFFTKESSDLTKKMRSTMKDLPKADIFGKPDVEYPKTEYPFVAKPPSKGQRYELNKMVIVDKVNTINEVKSARANHVQLKWEEEPDKQSYDRSRLTWKIGNGKPVIKKIEAKAAFDAKIAYKKIGEDDDAQRLKKEKTVDIKIGHPNNEYVYGKKKEREDGFLANRKEIVGEAYQRSTFFV